MHDIEPHYGWRDSYIASEDDNSPFYGRAYDEFSFTNKIYNYYIHPQWDYFGSETLYTKVIYVDYDESFAVIEFIGEWNDCLHNDVMTVKNEIADNLIQHGILKFILCCDNVLNFHASDESYYEEWFDEIKEDRGWICLLNTREHYQQEMNTGRLMNYVSYGEGLMDINWRKYEPFALKSQLELILSRRQLHLH